MRNTKWTWRVFFAGLALLIIGGIGFAFTFNGNVIEKGEAYNKTFTLTDDKVENITLNTEHDSNIIFKESQNGKNYVEVSGHYTKSEIEQIKTTEVQNDGTTLNLEVKNKEPFVDFMKINIYGKQEITIYLNKEQALKELVVEGNSSDMMVSDGSLQTLKVSASSGEIQLERTNADQISVNNDSGDTRLVDLTGDTNVKASSGEIEAARIDGDLTTETTSGDIDAENVTGSAIKLVSNSGSISADNFSAKQISLETNSGDIEGSQLDGKVHSTSSSGSIELDGLGASASAKTSSGDIELAFNQEPKTVTVDSNSGEVNVTLPAGIKAIYNVRSDSGDIKMPNNSKNASSEINAVTSSGDIKISD
ncbi:MULTISPECIES: DUF4097 family beta strand repeat-containing protein [Listeria]|uniref:DUF4097 family beta strand repeat-containing protein n=1 Tax=Listeria TaxID=1637 RepID=UPI000B58E041|nr:MULTISPECIES: DUF4097 family beta strand repeat-containing protein [Listeria]